MNVSCQKLLFIFITSLFLGNIVSAAENVEIHGFISQGYLMSTANNFFAETEEGTFQFNEMGINFTTKPTDKLHLGLQFLAWDLGRFGNDKPVINWAYGDYRFKDYLGVRAGIIRLSFGLYNEERDMDVLRPNIFNSHTIYNESWRDILSSLTGISIYGSIEIGSVGKLKYIVQEGMSNISKDGGASSLLEDQVPGRMPGALADITEIKVEQMTSASLFWESIFSITGLRVGISGFDLRFNATTDITYGSLSLPDQKMEVRSRPLFLSVEYEHDKFCFSSEYGVYTWDLMLAGIKVPQFDSGGYNISMAYRLFDNLELYSAISIYYGNNDDKEGKDNLEGQDFRGWFKEAVYAARFDINASWILKLETHFIDGTALLLDMDQGTPEPIQGSAAVKYPYEREWILFAAKLSYSF